MVVALNTPKPKRPTAVKAKGRPAQPKRPTKASNIYTGRRG